MKKDNLVVKTTTDIINIITEEKYEPGTKIPNEYELSTRLGVGRNTIREAIRALVSRNIVEVKRGSGTFVSKKMGVADDPLGFSFMTDKTKLALDLMEIRLMIEPQIALLAAENATTEDIENLEKIFLEFKSVIISGKNHLQKDIEFHTQIAKCSKNLIVPKLLPIINESLLIFFEFFEKMDISTAGKRTIDLHEEIFKAIKNKNPNKAKEIMTYHLLYNKIRLESLQDIKK